MTLVEGIDQNGGTIRGEAEIEWWTTVEHIGAQFAEQEPRDVGDRLVTHPLALPDRAADS